MCNVLVAVCIVAGSILGSLIGSAIITNNTRAKYNVINEESEQ